MIAAMKQQLATIKEYPLVKLRLTQEEVNELVATQRKHCHDGKHELCCPIGATPKQFLKAALATAVSTFRNSYPISDLENGVPAASVRQEN